MEDTDNEFMDFDQMVKEDVKGKPHKYKLFGIEGEIPAKIPFGLVIQYQRNKARKDDEAGLDLTVQMLEAIFGKDVVSQWCTVPEFDDETMMVALNWGLEKYGLGGKGKKVERGKLRVVKE